MESQLSFVPLLIVVSLAFLVPLLLSRFPQVPVVVGEILAGVIVGRSGLGLVHEEVTLELLAEIGFAFLLFLSGLEIDFSVLISQSPRSNGERLHPVWMASLTFAITIILALLVGFSLVDSGFANDPWFTALIISTTSLGIVVPVLKERGLSSGRFGQTLLLAALFADFFTMFLITVYVAAFTTGLTLEILLVGLLFLAVLLAYRLGLGLIRRPNVRRLIVRLEGATGQIKVRFALALLMAFVVLAESVNIELILGAFLAGAVISLLSRPEDKPLQDKLDALGYGFFIPVFFIMVGVQFDLRALIGELRAILLAGLLLLAAFGLKYISALALKASFSWRQTLAGGALLSARLSLIIAAAAIGLRINAINEATNAAIILVAALTSTLAPLMFNWFLPASPRERERRFLIFGAASIGIQVAQELKSHGEIVYFLEPDPTFVRLARKEGFEVIEGGSTVECLDKARATEVETLLVLTGGDRLNYEVSKTAVSMGVESIVTLVNEPKRLSEFKELGVNAMAPSMFQPVLLSVMARNPDLFALLTSTTDDRDIREVYMLNAVFAGIPVSELVFPGDSQIMTIVRQGEVLIPHGSTRLEYGDRLTIVGNLEALGDFQRLMNGRKTATRQQ